MFYFVSFRFCFREPRLFLALPVQSVRGLSGMVLVAAVLGVGAATWWSFQVSGVGCGRSFPAGPGWAPPSCPSAGAGRRPHPWRPPAFCLKGSASNCRGPSSYCGWYLLGGPLGGIGARLRGLTVSAGIYLSSRSFLLSRTLVDLFRHFNPASCFQECPCGYS